MSKSSLKEKTAKGLFWGGLSNGLQQLLGLAFGIISARILEVGDYGLIGMLAIFSSVAGAIINSGFSVALTNKKDATHKDYNAVFWFTVFVGAFLYVILFFCAPLIAQFYEKSVLTNLSRVLFISFFIGGMGTVPYTIMHKKLMVKEQARVEILALLISCIVGLILALTGFAYWALAIQSLLFISLSSIFRFLICPWRPTLSFDFRPIKAMIPFSIKIFATNIFSYINANILSVIFGKLYDEVQVGYYAQGQKWMGMGNTLLSGMINSVAQPVLVHIRDEKERQVNVFRKMVRFGAFLSIPLMLGLAFVAEEFIVIAIGEKWIPSIPFLQLFCVWGAFAFLNTLYAQLLLAHGKSNIFMYGNILIGLLQIAAIFSLSFMDMGVLSMVIGYVLVYFLGLFFWQYHASKLIRVRLKHIVKDIFPYLIITLGCFLATWVLTRNIQNIYLLLVAKIAMSVIFYIVIMKISKSVIFDESISFLKKVRK